MSPVQPRVQEESGACQFRRVKGIPKSLSHTADGSSPASGVEVGEGGP